MELERSLNFVNGVLGTQLTVDRLEQVIVREDEDEGRVEYRFTVDTQDFAVTKSGFSVLRSCVMCDRLVSMGSISSHEERLGKVSDGPPDPDRILAKLADLMERHRYCQWHQPPDNTELEARVRQLVREELDDAGFADEHHSHDDQYADLYHGH